MRPYWRLYIMLIAAAIIGTCLAPCISSLLSLPKRIAISRPSAMKNLDRIVDGLRDRPIGVKPQVRHLLRLSFDELKWLERQIQPPQHGNLSDCLHVLRVHGIHRTFEKSTLRSGEDILELLTDPEKGKRYFGRAVFVHTRSGIRCCKGVAVNAAESHRDYAIASLAEQGIRLSTKLHVSEEEREVRDLLRDSVANFHLGQEELEWTVLAYALYMPPTRQWVNRYGEEYSFDSAVRELLNRKLHHAACAGTHIAYTLTIVARVDREFPILTTNVRELLWSALRRYKQIAIQSQEQDGSWHIDWFSELMVESDRTGWHVEDSDDSRLLATGHLAEWLLYLPDTIPVPDETLRMAALWLLKRLKRTNEKEREPLFCPYAHAVRVVRCLSIGVGGPSGASAAVAEQR